MFTTKADFNKVPYNIPQVAGKGDFDAYATDEEAKALKRLLGYAFYKQFIDGLAAITTYTWSSTVATVINREYIYGLSIWKALTVQTGTAPVAGINWELVEADNKWLRLKTGDTYQIREIDYEWKGMNGMLKPLVYSRWVRDNSTQFTGIGQSKSKSENADDASPVMEICKGYNEFARIAGARYNPYDTLYGFLSYNEEDYEDVVWTCPAGHMNAHGL